jgi:pyruvate/2-oxoglutarate dehydrogenase complex dihydrolipoamide acyltransferase (E2) component
LVEVTTDKIVADIPSPTRGRISKINYDVNQSCLVGNVLCEIMEDEMNMKEIKSKPEEIKQEKSNNSYSSDEDESDIVNKAVKKSKCIIIYFIKRFSHSKCEVYDETKWRKSS